MLLRINVHFANGSERLFENGGENVVIGTNEDVNHISLLPDSKVSDPHAHIFAEAGFWWIEDLDSQTGTFLNGNRVLEKIPLRPRDKIQIGDNIIYVEKYDTDIFVLDESEGEIVDAKEESESQPGNEVSEHTRLVILAKIRNIVEKKSGQGMLAHILAEISKAIPQAKRASIILYRDKETIPVAFCPSEQSYMSFTLAHRAIYQRKAFIWDRVVSIGDRLIPSLLDTTAAIYVPILHNRRVHGVLHVDTNSPIGGFESKDLDLLREVAAAIGIATKTKAASSLRSIPSVFVSYAREDLTLVKDLANKLRRIPVSVWYDDRLEYGIEFKPQLEKAIEVVDAMVVILSPESVTSDWVDWEIKQAKRHSHRIIPIMYKECKVPKSLEKIQFVDIRDDVGKAVAELADLLYRLKEEHQDESDG